MKNKIKKLVNCRYKNDVLYTRNVTVLTMSMLRIYPRNSGVFYYVYLSIIGCQSGTTHAVFEAELFCEFVHPATIRLHYRNARLQCVAFGFLFPVVLGERSYTEVLVKTQDKRTKVELNVHVIIEISRRSVYFLLVIVYQLIFFKKKKTNEEQVERFLMFMRYAIYL